MKYRVLIVDDEEPARMLLANYVKQIPSLELEDACSNVFEAQNILNNTKIDILLTDIQMGKLTGFDLLKLLDEQPATIITSAYSEYALIGFDFNVVDYLLKPISFERFYEAINKAQNRVKSGLSHSVVKREQEEETSMFFKVDQKWVKIFFSDICFFESFGEYVKIRLKDQKRVVILNTMNNLEKILPQKLFLRIHRTFIVNLTHITEIEGNFILIDKEQIPVSRTRKDELFTRINLLR